MLARIISARLGCDLHRIEPADPYPDSYDETVQRNVREQDTNARPVIADPLPSIGGCETILLASPIWNVRAPMIMFERHRTRPRGRAIRQADGAEHLAVARKY